jgi:signal transduction histidine kinase
MRIQFTYKPAVFPRLSRDLETAIFRVIQESLTNAYRHSGSQEARIDIEQSSNQVTVRVRDFGKGLGPSASTLGVGISGMKERVKQLNGELRVSRAEPGCLVEATLPLLDVGVIGMSSAIL